jgi:hypothetical protein
MASTSGYRHKPLKTARSTRVIILKGTSRGLFRKSLPNQPLEIELEEVSLDDFPSYEALSYTWDGQVPDRPVRCHGKTLNITRNCERALFRLRTSSKRRLWVDSICIDQTSPAEKSIHIPLMGDVYGRASTVLLWLGDATSASDISFKYLEDVCQIINPYKLHLLQQKLNGMEGALPQHAEQQVMERSLSFQGKTSLVASPKMSTHYA